MVYAYLAPNRNEVLYIGKADYCSVGERARGVHKRRLYRWLVRHAGMHRIRVIVGLLYLPVGTRYSSQLLSDIESLLIAGLRPVGNIQNTQSRIARLGMALQMRGKWPLAVRKIVDCFE